MDCLSYLEPIVRVIPGPFHMLKPRGVWLLAWSMGLSATKYILACLRNTLILTITSGFHFKMPFDKVNDIYTSKLRTRCNGHSGELSTKGVIIPNRRFIISSFDHTIFSKLCFAFRIHVQCYIEECIMYSCAIYRPLVILSWIHSLSFHLVNHIQVSIKGIN